MEDPNMEIIVFACCFDVCICSRSNCLLYSFDRTWNSATHLFNSGFQRAADQDQAKLLAVFDPYKGDYKV